MDLKTTSDHMTLYYGKIVRLCLAGDGEQMLAKVSTFDDDSACFFAVDNFTLSVIGPLFGIHYSEIISMEPFEVSRAILVSNYLGELERLDWFSSVGQPILNGEEMNRLTHWDDCHELTELEEKIETMTEFWELNSPQLPTPQPTQKRIARVVERALEKVNSEMPSTIDLVRKHLWLNLSISELCLRAEIESPWCIGPDWYELQEGHWCCGDGDYIY